MAKSIALIDAGRMSVAGKKPGWTRSEDAQAIANESPGVDTRVLHVMVCNDGAILYDTILRCERGGGVFLPVDTEGRIGLQKQWRPQTNDMATWKANYPNIDVTELGRDSWEVPRGFSNAGETAAQTADREAREETQSVVCDSKTLGEVCDNTTFSPHLTGVQIGTIDPSRKPADKEDPNEKMLTPVKFFTLQQIKQMCATGQVYDGYTLAAIGLYYIDTYGG